MWSAEKAGRLLARVLEQPRPETHGGAFDPLTRLGFVLLPRRWVVERSFAWATRFRRLVKDYERYASTLADLHLVAFVCLMLRQAAQIATGS